MKWPVYLVGELQPPSKPFAVVAIYPERRMDDGCQAIIVSLHDSREEADRVLASQGGITETQQ